MIGVGREYGRSCEPDTQENADVHIFGEEAVARTLAT